MQGIREMGFEELFPIQAEAITPILKGRDVLGQAHTGSGKTLAYALPMLHTIRPKDPGIQGLVVVPTRELAVQVAGEFEKLARHLPVKAVAIYGGQSMLPQLDRLNNPSTKIVVATPGRLMDHLERGTIRLNNVRIVVLDEADRMLDMGFIEDVTFILQHVPRNHQTALFSATIPEEIVRLGRKYMKDPLRIFVDTEEISVDSVQQKFVRVEENTKFSSLCDILEKERIRRGLIFCETKIRAGRLAQGLRAHGYNALALHGDLSQHQRDVAVRSFRDGGTDLLVATEVAARGLDIPKVSHVINYDMPGEPLMYFHRIGRTARAGRAGVALSLVSRSDESGFANIRGITSSRITELDGASTVRSVTGSAGFFLPPRPSRGRTGRVGFRRGSRARGQGRRNRKFRSGRRR
jgi:ATP-dependent RNA helicase DeaD